MFGLANRRAGYDKPRNKQFWWGNRQKGVNWLDFLNIQGQNGDQWYVLKGGSLENCVKEPFCAKQDI